VIVGVDFLPICRRINNIGGLFASGLGVALVCIIASWALGQWATKDRWDRANMTESYETGRLQKIESLLTTWIEAGPITWIIGLGNCASFDENIIGSYPHIVAGEILGEEGLIGFGLATAIFALAMRALWRSYKVCRDYPTARGVVACMGAIFIFEVILSFKQGALIGLGYILAFPILLGLLERGFAYSVYRQPATPAGTHDVPYSQGYAGQSGL